VLTRTFEELGKVLRALVISIVWRIIGGRRGDRRLDEMVVSDFPELSHEKPMKLERIIKPLRHIKNGTSSLRKEPFVAILLGARASSRQFTKYRSDIRKPKSRVVLRTG